MSNTGPQGIQAFITKWEVSGAAERANAQLFIAELCDVIGVEHPHPKTPDEHANAYVFEKAIPVNAPRPGSAPVPSTHWVDTPTTNYIDCYKRGHFVLETKQGADAVGGGAGADDRPPVSAEGEQRQRALKKGHGIRGTKGWDTAMLKAREQAQRYARALPKEEISDGRPPFILVVDVGHSIALYTDWSRMGGEYIPYPDPATYRIPLKDLLRSEVRELLHAVWTDPLALDPGRRSAKVTRAIADRLAKLARSLEGNPGSGAGVTYSPEHVANFLMRCLFTMFSEDVDLLPHGSFTKLLGELKSDPSTFPEMMENLWGTMNTGGLSPILRKKLPRFNGGLFAHADAIALDADQIQLLIEAATANWRDVEPAIFGTLLERALDPRERHKLGAHYTPRAYVERLVNPTVIDPLREQWKSVQVAALQLAEDGNEKKAIKQVETFLHELATVKVLDPACGSGNFLYVTLELLKRLEGEVLNTLHELGATAKMELEGVMVTPANFYGIELNPRAAAIAEQVLWIGFLQWHLRTHGNLHNLPEPIIKDLHNIQCRDAVLDYDSKTEQRDANGEVVTKWDGRTTKPHPVTGEEVPDPEAREPVYTYSNPKPAKWPAADYIVGNPPFLGKGEKMRAALGDGYIEALRKAHTHVPDSADFVMFWWDMAAELTRTKKAKRFGLISTKTISQAFNRRLIDDHLNEKKALSIAFAIPNHPWVDSSDGAAVRIAMTVGVSGGTEGVLQNVTSETDAAGDDEATISLDNARGKIFSDLTIGADVAGAVPLLAASELHSNGMMLAGSGFIVEPEEARQLGLGSDESVASVIKPYRNGRDLTQVPRGVFLIDLHGMEIAEVQQRYPAIYQRVLDHVKPTRDQNRRVRLKEKWWLFGEARKTFRKAIVGVRRYIVTPETAKHRFFVFLDAAVVPDHGTIALAIDDAFYLGVLSSSIHVTWALAAGGRLGVGDDPRYNKSRCLDPFPFPASTPAQQEKIRALGEQLDAHRKRQQALHPALTMTGMYNVLERLKALGVGGLGVEPLTAKEKVIYEQGLVGILKQLHDELDAAVAEAYDWSDLFPMRHSGGRVIEDHLSRPSGVSRMPTDPAAQQTTTDEILTRLVALNAERAAEEAQGHVRWLRPEYQNPVNSGSKQLAVQGKLVEDDEDQLPLPTATANSPRPWPKDLPAQAAALTEVLGTLAAPATVEEIAAHFEGKRSKKRVDEMTRLLETLAAVGRAVLNNEQWSAV